MGKKLGSATRQVLTDYRMTHSLIEAGNCCWDNAAIQRSFKTSTEERAYQTRYTTRNQARVDIVDEIKGFKSRQRRRSAINYQTPLDAEAKLAV